MAIGKRGQNARLAVRLTGWKIDIKSVSEAKELGLLEQIDQPIPVDDDFQETFANEMMANQEEIAETVNEETESQEIIAETVEENTAPETLSNEADDHHDYDDDDYDDEYDDYDDFEDDEYSKYDDEIDYDEYDKYYDED